MKKDRKTKRKNMGKKKQGETGWKKVRERVGRGSEKGWRKKGDKGRGGKEEKKKVKGIFSYTPELHVAFCPIFVHPLFPVFEPHITKWVIFVRRPLVSLTLSDSNPRPKQLKN